MSQTPARSPAVVFLGWLLMAVGALIALTTGACTAWVLAGLFANGSGGYGSAGGWALLSLLFGGVPCLVGLGLFFGGRRLARPLKTPARAIPVPEHDDEPTTGA